MEDKSKEIVLTNQEVNNFTNFSSMEELLAFSTQIAKSGLSPLKKGEDVMSAILMGKELGLGTMTAITNIYSVSGKASLGVHVINALLLKAGVTYKILEDYRPIYGTKQGTQEKVLADYRTTIEFFRLVKRADGNWKEMSIISTYSYNDAKNAGLTDKDNWKNHPKTMTRNRAIAIGGRMIAGDILLGCYETSELLEVNNKPHIVTEDGHVTILETKQNEPQTDAIEEVTASVEVNEEKGNKNN